MCRGGLTGRQVTCPELGKKGGASSIGEFGDARNLEVETTKVDEPDPVAAIGYMFQDRIHDVLVICSKGLGM